MIDEDQITNLENGTYPVGEMGLMALAEALNQTFYIYNFSSELRVVNPGYGLFFLGFDGEHYVGLTPGEQTLEIIGLVPRGISSNIEFYDSDSE